METLAIQLVDSIFVGGKIISILNTVGTNVIIRTLSTTTSSIGFLISNITTSDKKYLDDVKGFLETMDLEHKVNVVKELVREISGKDVKDSVKLALLGITEILDKINKELLIIKDATDYHNSKFFGNWRKFDCSCNIETLEKHKKLLDARYSMLLDLVNLYK